MKIVRNLGTLTFKLQNTPPPLEFRHFLVLCDFSVAEYPPPPPENSYLGRSWYFVTFPVAESPPLGI